MFPDLVPVTGSTLFYRPQRSCDQGNIFTPVCHSFCSQGGGGLPQCMLGYHPPPGADTPLPRTRHSPKSRPHPPGADTPPQTRPPRTRPPWEQTPPGSKLRHTVNERPVRILLECILVLHPFISFTFNIEPFSLVTTLKLPVFTYVFRKWAAVE